MTLRPGDYDTDQCVLHLSHSPVTVVNELHHPLPQEWQRAIWGEVRDHRTLPVCATGHNSIHAALNLYVKRGVWPDWCVGRTREMCERGIQLREAALRAVAA